MLKSTISIKLLITLKSQNTLLNLWRNMPPKILNMIWMVKLTMSLRDLKLNLCGYRETWPAILL
jgi:hypothetical protein